jgi:predicted outer membrane repeat protein
MLFTSWLRNRTLTDTPRRRTKRRSVALRVRPQLEALDERCLPSTLTVTNTLDSGPGSLRAEIAAAAAQGGDTIVFSSTLKGQITLTGEELLINKSLTIQGPGAGQLAISGGNSSRVFEVAAGVQDTLAGLTITGGDGNPAAAAFDGNGGGAILNWGTLTLSSSTVSGNTAYPSGGGIYSAGALTISSSTVSGNSASIGGGGIYNGGSLTVIFPALKIPPPAP